MNVIAIIPARKGSKRLPGKNMMKIAGKTLIAHTIESAKGSEHINRIIVNSDDDRVISEAINYNVDHMIRPDELAEDNTPIQDVIDYILQQLSKNEKPDIMVLLQPTNPLRTPEQIDRCIDMFINQGFDTVISVREIAPHVYYPNGLAYVFRDKIWSDNTGMLLMTQEESTDIDTDLDFRITEMKMNDYGRGRSKS